MTQRIGVIVVAAVLIVALTSCTASRSPDVNPSAAGAGSNAPPTGSPSSRTPATPDTTATGPARAGAGRVRVEAHRGGPALGAPASSARLIRRAVAAGVDRVELDVYFTSDKVAVINHTDTIEDAEPFTTVAGRRVPARNCSHDGRTIHAMTYAQVRRVRCGGEPLPTLAQAMAILKGSGTTMNLEVKARSRTEPARSKRDSARRAVRQAVAAGMTDQMVVSTFSWRELAPVIRSVSRRVYLIGFLPVRDVRQPTAAMYRNARQAKGAGVDALGMDADYAPVPYLRFIKGLGLDLALYGLNTAAKIRYAAANGQHWIGSDDPSGTRRLLDQGAATTRERRSSLGATVVYAGPLRATQRQYPQVIGAPGLVPAAAQARLRSIRVAVTIRSDSASGHLELAPQGSRPDRDGVRLAIRKGTQVRIVEVAPGDNGRLRLRTTGSIQRLSVTVLGYRNVR